jgi:hypothetical protein
VVTQWRDTDLESRQTSRHLRICVRPLVNARSAYVLRAARKHSSQNLYQSIWRKLVTWYQRQRLPLQTTVQFAGKRRPHDMSYWWARGGSLRQKWNVNEVKAGSNTSPMTGLLREVTE